MGVSLPLPQTRVCISNYLLNEKASEEINILFFFLLFFRKALLNGVGFFNCEKYANGKPCQTNSNRLEIQVPPKQRSRLRLIQAGSHALFKVSVDGHPLEVIEADATPVQSSQLFHRIPLHNAER